MVALRPISIGEQLLAIPFDIILSRETGLLRSPMRCVLEDTEYGRDSFTGLVLLLMFETQNPDSFWRQFLALLPSQFDTPLFWSDNDLEILQPTPMYSEMVYLKEFLQLSYQKYVFPWISQFSILKGVDFSFDRFLWAISTVWNRAYWIDQDDTLPGIVPLADMLNHSPHPGLAPHIGYGKCHYQFDSRSTCFTVISCDVVPPGQEVFTTYGHKDNENLLSDYGFVLDLPPSEDHFTLDLSFLVDRIPTSTAALEQIATWLKLSLFLPSPTASTSRSVPPKLKVTPYKPWELIAFCRLLTIDSTALSELTHSSSHQYAILTPFLEPQDEKSALLMAKGVCLAQSLMATLPGVKPQDSSRQALIAHSFVLWYRGCLERTVSIISTYLDSLE
jgi:hypothetical protein